MYDPDRPYKNYELHIGFVTDDRDPQKQGRVTVRVPGLLEPGGIAEVIMPGSPFNRGDYIVPVVGGQVIVGFLEGELDHPVIFGGIAPPVLADGSRASVDKNTLPQIRTFETEDFVFVLGKSGTIAPYAAIYSRHYDEDSNGYKSRVAITLDLDSKAVSIEAPVSISIKTKGTLELDGNVVRIANRVVSQNKQPI